MAARDTRELRPFIDAIAGGINQRARHAGLDPNGPSARAYFDQLMTGLS